MATTKYDLTAAAWVDCGVSPCFIQATQPVLFVIDGSAPGALDAAAHLLAPSSPLGREATANIGLTSKVFARAVGAAASLIVSR